MSEIDKAEYQRIETAIKATEDKMASNPHIRQNASAAITEPAKRRLETLDREGHGLLNPDNDRKKQSIEAAQIAILVLQESHLNSAEKQTYGGFLQCEYFTRSDFGKLEEFYADGGAWDRLSPEGKKQMSDRFWGGIEQGEYTLDETPDNVRKKEVGQLAYYLEHPEQAPESIKRMNPKSKEEFLEARKAGNETAALEILNNRDLFESSTKVMTQEASERSELASGEKAAQVAKAEKAEDAGASLDSDRGPEGRSFASFEIASAASPTDLPSKNESADRTPT